MKKAHQCLVTQTGVSHRPLSAPLKGLSSPIRRQDRPLKQKFSLLERFNKISGEKAKQPLVIKGMAMASFMPYPDNHTNALQRSPLEGRGRQRDGSKSSMSKVMGSPGWKRALASLSSVRSGEVSVLLNHFLPFFSSKFSTGHSGTSSGKQKHQKNDSCQRSPKVLLILPASFDVIILCQQQPLIVFEVVLLKKRTFNPSTSSPYSLNPYSSPPLSFHFFLSSRRRLHPSHRQKPPQN